MRAKDLLAGRAWRFTGAPLPDAEIENIVTSDETVSENSVFVCTRTAVRDGHYSAWDAYSRGCRVFVARRGLGLPEAATVLVCEDTEQALAELSAALYGPLPREMKILGVTGTHGKSAVALLTAEILRQSGYRQYEISNFCKRGYESRHNMKYWTGGEYLGFGPNASSDFAGQRFTIIRDLRGYIQGIRTGGQVLQEIQSIPQRERAGEYLMMRLRTNHGINAEEYEKQYLLPFAPLEAALEQCRLRGHAIRAEGNRWRLTGEGFLLSNSIISDLQLIQETSIPLAKRRT